jgi:hypothetical protein
LSRKQTTKEWLMLPIRGAPKCVSCVICEMGPLQNDTRNENCWGRSIVTRAHKSNIYMGTYVSWWHYTQWCIAKIQYIKISQIKALRQTKIRHSKTKCKYDRKKTLWIYKSRLQRVHVSSSLRKIWSILTFLYVSRKFKMRPTWNSSEIITYWVQISRDPFSMLLPQKKANIQRQSIFVRLSRLNLTAHILVK